MKGYLNNPEATSKTVINGWTKTGDVGYFDDENYIKIEDRLSDVIQIGNEKVIIGDNFILNCSIF